MITNKHLLVPCTFLALFACASVCADVFVDPEKGSDKLDGSIPIQDGELRGPVATIRHAVAIRKPDDRIVLTKTQKPYRESIDLTGTMGTPGKPLIIEGNGAVLEGLAISKPEEWKEEGNGILSTEWGAGWGFFVVADEKPPARAASLEALQPGECFADYEKHRGYYRLAGGQALGRTKLELPQGFCGVSIQESSHIVIRNLICQYFWNDGFNIQGDSQDIRLENVTGRLNGDEGISAHGTSDVTVIGADLHHNDNGVCDTVLSKTRYIGVNVHHNRAVGVWFQGGDHTLVDTGITENPTGFVIEEGQGAVQLPGFTRNTDVNCRATLRNVLIRDGNYGIQAAHRSQLSMDHVTLLGQPVGISIRDEGVFAHVVNSIIVSSRLSIEGKGSYWGDYNCWANPAAELKGQRENLKEWSAKNGMDAHSVFADPLLKPSGELDPASQAIGKAYVDDENYEALKRHGFWSDAHPPRVNRNMGAEPRWFLQPGRAD